MKLQFKYQKFQADAAKSVVDVFAGQSYAVQNYLIDSGEDIKLYQLPGIANNSVELSDTKVFENLQKVQLRNNIASSESLSKIDGGFNLTIEMETGVGKTYTYIKTMYELNKNFGWSKFIIVVPSIAIREGVYKTFQVTEEHFAEEYGKKIKFFIYNSSRLTEIERFAEDNEINAMIINSQAFNSRSESSRRIRMELDEFRSRRPIDVIAKTNPILIIDEPQSVEGKNTKESLKEFKPILTLRYSATHKEFYNLIYRLDALDAYNKKLVKEISVVGIKASGTTATEGYVYLEKINLFPNKPPTATIHFDCKTKNGIGEKIRSVNQDFDIYEHSGELEEYRNNFVVKFIDGRDNSVEFLNGIKIFVGDILGKIDEVQLRKIQIRETIKSHLQKESQLFGKGIKVLSLFFIDEVAHYKIYDSAGNPKNGDFANWFEEIYSEEVEKFRQKLFDENYENYLSQIPVEKTHAGYFSIDNKGKLTDSKITNRKESLSDDIDAYDLIMKNKELLLDQNPEKSPVRFIFSHSALREGWDNPNVFQICTLKQSGSDIRKRQEVGRGLRLCVNKFGERMDENILGSEVHKINSLTVIAGESYDDFTRKLQGEIAESIGDRPHEVTQDFFVGKILSDGRKIDNQLARKIYNSMVRNNYVDDEGKLTEKYNEDKKNSALNFTEEISDCVESVAEFLNGIYKNYTVKNAKSDNVEIKLDENKIALPKFQALWKKINAKTIYQVNFDTDEFVEKTIFELNKKLSVSKIYFQLESGYLDEIKSKEDLQTGKAFKKSFSGVINDKNIIATDAFDFDIISKLIAETNLTRTTIIKILSGMNEKIFSQYKFNPEEFILNAGKIINSQKAVTVIEHIKYNKTGEIYDINIFSDANLTGNLNKNAIATEKNLYNYLIYDSKTEMEFAKELETSDTVEIYVKLPSGFYITTPIGKYNPDWAIVFCEGESKNIYFIAETKGSMDSMQLRLIENKKIECAREHFKTISKDNLRYDVVHNYQELLDKILR